MANGFRKGLQWAGLAQSVDRALLHERQHSHGVMEQFVEVGQLPPLRL
jgi:hypothetical protein